MTLILQRHLFPALLALIAFFTALPFAESVLRNVSRIDHAIDWHGVKVSTPVVKPGDILEITYSAKINKQCPADLRSFLVAEDESVPIRFATLAGGYSKVSEGPRDILVKVKIPETSDPNLAPLKSGKYTYRTLATRYCQDGVEDDIRIPDAEFMLEVKQ